ncbi:Ig-like domain-containing protein [Mucilaginibacter myungsuensis]
MLATPVNQTRNFAAKQIKLDFDEYFKLTNQYQEITLSPTMETPPEYKVKGKSLVINFKDTLSKNTTYVVNFGKAIQDVNESNQLKNFTYVFSTGPHIDSLSISGTVVNTQTSLKEKDATVMIFPLDKDTTYFGKKKPAIFATTDSAGNFTLSNLHDGKYKIYALKETSVNRIFDQDAEEIAFLKTPVNLTKDTQNVQLSLFKQTPDKFRVTDRHFDPDGKMVLLFNRPVLEPSLKINHPAALDEQKIVDITKTRDSAYIYLKNMNFDSISVSVLEKGQVIETVSRTKSAKESYQRVLNFTYGLNTDSKLKPATDLILMASQPVQSFEQSRIRLLEDSVDKADFTIVKDDKEQRKFTLKYKWKQNAKYELQINDNAFTNIYGERNKRLLRQFQVDKLDNYGSVLMKVVVPDSTKSYIVEFIYGLNQVVRTDVVTKTTKLNYANLFAGKYRIKVTYDDNSNGVWDSGNVKKGLYPESIFAPTTVYTIRPLWEDEQTLEVPKQPIIP